MEFASPTFNAGHISLFEFIRAVGAIRGQPPFLPKEQPRITQMSCHQEHSLNDERLKSRACGQVTLM